MREAIFSILLGLVCLTFWMWQIDDNNTGLANERLKNAVNYAAHDASLQIDKSEVGGGRVVFDTVSAEEAFKKTLQDNLSLDVDLVPKGNTLFQEKFTVTYTDYIDDNDGVNYPYFYENNVFGIHRWIYGPAVIFAVEVPRPRAFNMNPSYNLVKWAVFEYPLPTL